MAIKNSIFFLGILVVYSLFCLTQLGVTWDTFFYYEMGKDRLDYLFSLGNDESFKRIPHSKYLPGMYSTLAAFFSQFFPKEYLGFSLLSYEVILSVVEAVLHIVGYSMNETVEIFDRIRNRKNL